mmetsp:Transcript_39238/g.54495  ORF Transcript_39238/g.54495 Transcript_39238/m.54495 type:complete len:230 (+) Transcript_39238:165-854(+)|eukprot:CAMPEP_0196588148 /NCGR_PEP_ID=MMETSP1081-20130531/59706_1 /TAXON_ID=36882 /ORGANISM="Pyramimonas amylifera, Strain CCMP720" /LENGTH=229 /DNA_ID=CAMNT_0041910567 /DNA_START=144 /DNA_END=833 /DNA_ORIENTATION=-
MSLSVVRGFNFTLKLPSLQTENCCRTASIVARPLAAKVSRNVALTCHASQISNQRTELESTFPRREFTSASLAALSFMTAGNALAYLDVEDDDDAPGGILAKLACPYITSATGLKYCDIEEGDGEAPASGTTIRAHYTGRLASNGAVFDSSYDRGSPLQFQVGVGKVIRGWDEGIVGGKGIPPMKAGGKRRLLIPSELGYGARGAGRGVIPPNADLLFDVELVRPSKFK